MIRSCEWKVWEILKHQKSCQNDFNNEGLLQTKKLVAKISAVIHSNELKLLNLRAFPLKLVTCCRSRCCSSRCCRGRYFCGRCYTCVWNQMKTLENKGHSNLAKGRKHFKSSCYLLVMPDPTVISILWERTCIAPTKSPVPETTVWRCCHVTRSPKVHQGKIQLLVNLYYPKQRETRQKRKKKEVYKVCQISDNII